MFLILPYFVVIGKFTSSLAGDVLAYVRLSIYLVPAGKETSAPDANIIIIYACVAHILQKIML